MARELGYKMALINSERNYYSFNLDLTTPPSTGPDMIAVCHYVFYN